MRQVFAYQMRPEQIGKLRTEFMKLDTYQNGEVSFDEFRSALSKAGVGMDDTNMKDLFVSIDFDHSGIIHWNEFLAATIDLSDFKDVEMRQVFEKLDSDGSGYITIQNLKGLVGEVSPRTRMKGFHLSSLDLVQLYYESIKGASQPTMLFV